jgi:hypothetical protein
MHRGPRHALTTGWPRPAQSAGPTLPPGGLTRQGSLTTSRPLRPSSPNVPKSRSVGSFSDNVGSYANGMKLGKAKRGGYSKFKYLQFNNFAILTLLPA